MSRLQAITRMPSARMQEGELTHLARRPIDGGRALSQHAAYCNALAECGVQVQVLSSEERLPDCAFVEDVALAFPELFVICRVGAPSRMAERAAVAAALPADRPSVWIESPATIEGGDVLVIGRHVFVGRSGRTNPQGVHALRARLEPHGYLVEPVIVSGALHLKTAVTVVSEDTLIINRNWVRPESFTGYRLIDVDADEPFAANALRVGERLLVQQAFPATAARLEQEGFRTLPVDISEFAKAEAGLTCMSVVY